MDSLLFFHIYQNLHIDQIMSTQYFILFCAIYNFDYILVSILFSLDIIYVWI